MSRDKCSVLGKCVVGGPAYGGWEVASPSRSVCRERYLCHHPQNQLQPGWSLNTAASVRSRRGENARLLTLQGVPRNTNENSYGKGPGPS